MAKKRGKPYLKTLNYIWVLSQKPANWDLCPQLLPYFQIYVVPIKLTWSRGSNRRRVQPCSRLGHLALPGMPLDCPTSLPLTFYFTKYNQMQQNTPNKIHQQLKVQPCVKDSPASRGECLETKASPRGKRFRRGELICRTTTSRLSLLVWLSRKVKIRCFKVKLR